MRADDGCIAHHYEQQPLGPQREARGVGGADLQGRGGIELADDFRYQDPIDNSVSEKQGVRLVFGHGGRLVLRLSGTGTEGATLRLYIEKFEPRGGNLGLDPQVALAGLINDAEAIIGIKKISGRTRPDVVT